MQITTIGLDLTKNVFQVHAVNGKGEAVVRTTLRRAQVLRSFERLAPWMDRSCSPLRLAVGSDIRERQPRLTPDVQTRITAGDVRGAQIVAHSPMLSRA